MGCSGHSLAHLNLFDQCSSLIKEEKTIEYDSTEVGPIFGNAMHPF